MAAYSSTLSASKSSAERRTTPLWTAGEDVGRFRFQVVAASVADAVAAAGGLIFDRATAGWEVTVALAAKGDDRPLKILGAKAADLTAVLVTPSWPETSRMLAVASDVLVRSDPIRRLALAAVDANAANFLLWGRRCPVELERTFAPVRYRPSAAAHVFKSHALAAVGAADSVAMAEEGFFAAAGV